MYKVAVSPGSFRLPVPRMSSARIYIGRLSYQVSERDIERFFKGHGRIREVLLKNGFGFVVSLIVSALTTTKTGETTACLLAS